MQSMRDNASRLRFNLKPLSLHELTSGFKCDPSLAAVCSLPERVEVTGSFDGPDTDVQGSYTFVVESNGRWEISARFESEASIFGDDFTFVLAIRIHNDPILKILTYKGSLGAGEAGPWSEAGMEPSFVHHWRDIVEQGLETHWRLRTAPITEEILLAIQLAILGPPGIVGGGYLLISGLSSWRRSCGFYRPTEPTPGVSVDYGCRWES